MADVIPLHRAKTVTFADAPARLLPVEKWPIKRVELKLRPRRWRRAATDPLAGLMAVKFAHPASRGGKLRLFRVFKLLTPHKHDPAAPRYRELGERLRAQRWLRRL